MIERDYLMRLVQQLAAALARIFKLKEQEQYDLALLETDKAFTELLGMNREVLVAFDSAMLARLLGHHERIKTAAALFQAEGEIQQRCANAEQARASFQRALELYCEAAMLQTKAEQECIRAITALTALLPRESIPPKLASFLAQISYANLNAATNP